MGFFTGFGIMCALLIVLIFCVWLWEMFLDRTSALVARYNERQAVVKYLFAKGEPDLAYAISGKVHLTNPGAVQSKPPQK